MFHQNQYIRVRKNQISSHIWEDDILLYGCEKESSKLLWNRTLFKSFDSFRHLNVSNILDLHCNVNIKEASGILSYLTLPYLKISSSPYLNKTIKQFQDLPSVRSLLTRTNPHLNNFTITHFRSLSLTTYIDTIMIFRDFVMPSFTCCIALLLPIAFAETVITPYTRDENGVVTFAVSFSFVNSNCKKVEFCIWIFLDISSLVKSYVYTS